MVSMDTLVQAGSDGLGSDPGIKTMKDRLCKWLIGLFQKRQEHRLTFKRDWKQEWTGGLRPEVTEMNMLRFSSGVMWMIELGISPATEGNLE